MADNVVANPGSGGETFASDDIGGVQFPRIKLVHGADGVNAGDVAVGNPLPVTGAVAEDTPHASGDRGMFVLAVRNDATTTLVDANGDYAPLQVNEVGRLKVAAEPAIQAAVTGNITGSAQNVVIDTTRVSNIMIAISGTYNGVNITFEGSLDGTNWFLIQAVRSDANTIETSSGAITNTVRAWEASVNGVSQFRVRSTAWVSGTAAIRIQPAPYATEPIPAAQISGTQPVSFTQPALVAGTALVGDVGIQYRANATGAASRTHIVSAASTNPTVVKASAGRLIGCCLANNTANWRYVKFHNQTTSPTAGSGVVQTVGIPPNGRADWNLPGGVAFSTGIALTIVTGAADADNTAIGAAEVVGDIFFA